MLLLRIDVKGCKWRSSQSTELSSTAFKSCSEEDKKSVTVYVIVGVVATSIFLLVMSTLWWKGYLQCRKRQRKDLEGMELQTVSFTLKQIKAATNNFDASNKIGEGGFGAVYKGRLSDGTSVAVKQLSHQSRQGNRVMSEAVGMLEGKRDVLDDIPEASTYTNDLRFNALKDFQRERQNQSASSKQAQLASIQTASDLCLYNPESRSD